MIGFVFFKKDPQSNLVHLLAFLYKLQAGLVSTNFNVNFQHPVSPFSGPNRLLDPGDTKVIKLWS